MNGMMNKTFLFLLIQIVCERRPIEHSFWLIELEIVKASVDDVLFGHCAQALKGPWLVDG